MSGRDSFNGSEWRGDIRVRRGFAVEIVKRWEFGEPLEPQLAALQRAIAYDTLSDLDRNSFRVFKSQMRIVCEGWKQVPDADRREFLLGRLPYSSLVKKVKAMRGF